MHGLLVAPPGLGKSCLLRLLVADLNPREFAVAQMTGMRLSATEWLQRTAERFDIETGARRGTIVRLLISGLEKMRTTPALIIDEAHQVPFEALDLIRSLAEDSRRPLLAMILTGDETLRRNLSRQAHAPLAQRMAARVELPCPDEQETAAWIEHAFAAASMKNILSPSAVSVVYAATDGVPREVGRILATAMELALTQQNQMLTDEIVQAALDGQLLPTP
jgi:type II secretory pathway predicted ATPase ExeA